MSKFCPEWIFGIFAAQTSKEFLSSNNSIGAVSKKYSKAISEKYNEVKFEEVVDLAEKILQFLSEINVGEEAVKYIDDYIHYRVNFEASGSERKLSGMFSSAFDAEKIKDYDSDKSFKIFKATIFSIRNNALPKATPGWLITDVEDIDWIGEVFNEEPELF
ncbi:hypothetical protein OAM56_09185 [Alphaproteobacteria bacterium]|nr:hypothetical protein [Alphaproteobacteria bacterium]